MSELPVGPDLGDWTPPAFIDGGRLVGRSATLEPLDPDRHHRDLFDHFVGADELWTYLPWGPMADAAGMRSTLVGIRDTADSVSYAVVVDGVAVGMVSYLRIDPRAGTIEIGGIAWSPTLQRTTASTEVIAMLIGHAFDSGYRRVEWKCDSLNAASRAAAERFGFRYEGTFRKHTHYKGRSRDTAWFAIVDDDWPPLRDAFAAWLDPDNLDADGRQRRSLLELRRQAGSGPQ